MKHWWQSRTILGALAVLIASTVRALVPNADLEHEEILNVLTIGAQFAGALLAIIGRFQAKERIKKPRLPRADRPS